MVRAAVVLLVGVVCLRKLEVGRQDVVRVMDCWLGVGVCRAGFSGVESFTGSSGFESCA